MHYLKTFLQAIREECPNEQVTRLVFADWCLENLPELESKLRIHIPPIDRLNIHPNCGHRRLYLYGNGAGYGYGVGYGYGNGIVYGYESGDDYGIGLPDGYGHGYGTQYQNSKLNMPKLHTNQLIFLTHNFVFCGFVQEHLEPYQFKLTNASLILSHDSSWHKVANNTDRKIQTRKYDTITIGPQFFHSIDWIGDLP